MATAKETKALQTNSPPKEKEQSLVDHLIELRDRLLKAILSIVVIFICLVAFMNDIYNFLSSAVTAVLPEGSNLIIIDPLGSILVPLKLTFFVSLYLSVPVILYQAWAFIAPGLYNKEKSFVIPLMVSSVALFYLGIAFAYFVLFRVLFKALVGFSVGLEGVVYSPDVGSLLNFSLTIFTAFGFAFEVPVAVFLAIWSGLVEPDTLAEKRPYIVVGFFVLAMFLTPADVISQPMLAIPMWLLFEVGLKVGRLVKKRSEEKQAETEAE